MKNYWQDLEELNNESIEKVSQDNDGNRPDVSLVNILADKSATSRRDFLKLFGFSVASASVLSSCEKPVTKAIPYLIKPETVTPGKADYYASTFYDGEQYSSILVKVRDGRPIKIEGNELSPLSEGSSSAIVQASVLELYDDNRIQRPHKNGQEISWELADKEILEQLKSINDKQGHIVLLSSTIISPSTRAVIDKFKDTCTSFEQVMYDPASVHGILEANKRTLGKRMVPTYHFDKAKVIVSFGADFLGNWLSPIEFTKGYIAGRKLDAGENEMSRHIQFEAGMSLTGSNADERLAIKPSEEKLVLATLYHKLLLLSGRSTYINLPQCEVELDALSKELNRHRGKSLVVSGSNDPEIQVLVNAINYELGNYGATIDTSKSILTKQGDDNALKNLAGQLEKGEIAALLCCNANPVYDTPWSEQFKKGIEKTELSISFATSWDETSAIANYVCPDSHFLESWNDANPRTGVYSLAQPAIRNLFDTRQFQDSLLTWSGQNTTFLDFLKREWSQKRYSANSVFASFTDFWNHTLQDGVFDNDEKLALVSTLSLNGLDAILNNIVSSDGGEAEIHFYENNSIGTGKHTNNPWLQETPDAVSKICWDNFAAVSPKYARDNALQTGDVIKINNKFEVPVLVQPGQKYGTLSIALGYGREKTGKAGIGVGFNAYRLIKNQSGFNSSFVPASISKTGKAYELAMTQTHNSMEGRPLIRETTLEEYIESPSAGNELHEKIEHHLESLYEAHKYEGHHWGMTVDLNSCIGCNACVVGCTAENNVPVVGKEEVRRVHEMHWIRIDRYYAGDPENPEVARQPVMCQHCDNAPCENVCPVAATTHSDEGINQMAYNRCIGTRYCNNNCPYKVRRFNWYDYTQADALPANTMDPAGMTLDLPRMVLNPDVTVRAKGVMEKCSFCVQRIQDKKLQAKLEGRPLADGEIKLHVSRHVLQKLSPLAI
jgi:MoCo/4Fe-4S cofactor protein with predicted Tat translocation signal